MNLDEFQAKALQTDRTVKNYEGIDLKVDIIVSLLGIAGELGTLATSYKKFLRDGSAYALHKSHVKEEIGDLLWYLAILANKFELSLSELAQANLAKVEARWSATPTASNCYDEAFQPSESLPRQFVIKFVEETHDGQVKAVMYWDGTLLGNPLTDNADVSDDYRFHDAFHLAFAAVLGWSPVVRKLMKKKRRSVKAVDENQDGGRAIVIEEGIVAYAFEYGVSNGMLMDAKAVDYEILKTAQDLTRRLEVRDQPTRAWEDAIRAGFKVFRQLTEHRGGYVTCDLDARTIEFSPLE